MLDAQTNITIERVSTQPPDFTAVQWLSGMTVFESN
jgi:hypothetical protein